MNDVQPTGKYEFRTSRIVEFADTDMAGIIHFSRYYVYMERAEHEFWNSLGTSVHAPSPDDPSLQLGWPRLESSCRFIRPVRFEDRLDIVLHVAHIGTKSLTFEVDFLHEHQLVAQGRLVTCCCALEAGKAPRGVEIPPSLRARLAEAPAKE